MVVGDATLVEDTFFNEQLGALYQANNALVLNLVDSLALDPDLVELRGRNTKVRLLKLVEARRTRVRTAWRRVAARRSS